MSKNKGFTIVELLVSMSIFMILSTFAVGTFVTSIQLKQYASITTNSQQKVRTALEIVTRMAKEATGVTIKGANAALPVTLDEAAPNPGRVLELRYKDNSGYRVSIIQSGSVGILQLEQCSVVAGSFTGCTSSQNLLGGGISLDIDVSAGSFFYLEGANPMSLEIKLVGDVLSLRPNPYFSDSLTVDTIVLLENLK
jgi:prepilin-type N-terminal cleavage/methylation domain-containing protein